jgi:multidrug efflux pump subunit AcrA (membrane-fusion protein)
MSSVVMQQSLKSFTKTGLQRAIAGARGEAAASQATVASQSDVTGSQTSADGWSWNFFSVPTAILFGVVLLMATAQPWKLLRTGAAAAGETVVELVKQVMVATPSTAKTANVVLPATIRPWQTTTLNARVSGYLTVWHYDLGAQVRQGDLLAEIETPELDQQLAEGEALASEAAAAAAQARAELQEAQADLQVAESQLRRSEVEAELTKIQYERRKNLLTKNAISVEEYEIFQKQVEARTADVAAAKADVARRRTNLDTRKAVIEARDAAAKSRLANVERLRELLVFKRIVAPFDGIVTQRSAEVGMLVTAGTQSLFTVEDMSRVRVQVNVPQTYAAQTGVGTTATVSLPESTSAGVSGAITRVAQAVDAKNRTMLAEIELANADGRLQPGSYVHVALSVPQNDSSWTIPTNTVQMLVEGPHVAVVNEQNEVELKPIVLGRDLGNRVVVSEGIAGNERLIVNPTDDLVGGLRVEVTGDRTSAKVARR